VAAPARQTAAPAKSNEPQSLFFIEKFLPEKIGSAASTCPNMAKKWRAAAVAGIVILY
jgi:hypothetical protein